jgi:peptide/nickel transport system ATP-binding protein
LFANARHPYSHALMSATVDLGVDVTTALPAIAGQPPLPGTIPRGCSFRPRCSRAVEACADEPIDLLPLDGSLVRCIRPISSDPGSGTHPGTARDAAVDTPAAQERVPNA